MPKKLQLLSVLAMVLLLTACSSKSPLPSGEQSEDLDKPSAQTDTEKLQKLVGRENESWVSLVILNNSSTEIDFSYFDVPDNSVGIILAPGEKAGDDKNGESDLKLVALKNVDSVRYKLVDNKSGEGWYFDIKPEDKAAIVTISDGDPYTLNFQYMDSNGQIFNY